MIGKDDASKNMSASPRRTRRWIWLGLIVCFLTAGILLYVHLERINAEYFYRRRSAIIALAISNAVEQFWCDYNKLPCPINSSPAGSDTDTDSSPESRLIAILTGKEGLLACDTPVNPRRRLIGSWWNWWNSPVQQGALPHGPWRYPQNLRNIDYAEGIKPARPSLNGMPPWKEGLMFAPDTKPGIVDGSGNYFRIRLDSDGNKEIDNPNPDQVAEGRTIIAKRVLVWSAGKDGNWDTWADNLMSWD